MYVPAGCPHAFFNPGRTPVRMLFAVAPSGHEAYLRELGDLLSTGARPDQPATPAEPAPAGVLQSAIEALRLRYDIHQLTSLVNRPVGWAGRPARQAGGAAPPSETMRRVGC